MFEYCRTYHANAHSQLGLTGEMMVVMDVKKLSLVKQG